MPGTDRIVRRTGRGLRGPARLALAAALALAAFGCARGAPSSDGQQTGWISSARFDGPPGTGMLRYRLAGDGVARGWPVPPRFELHRRTPESKIDPLLRRWIASHSGDGFVEVLVEYTDPVETPAFPLEGGALGFAPAEDSLALAGGQAIADSLVQLRAAWYGLERGRLSRDHGAAVLDSFWITRSVVARLLLRDVRVLAKRNDVESVQFAHRGGHAPFDCGNLPPLEDRNALVGDGRALLGSDPLRNAGYASGRLSLLDTGVWTGHRLLQERAASTAPTGPALVAIDCVSDPNCSGDDPGDTDTGPGGHGTTVCGILVGDGSMGDCLAGATLARVESHRVYAVSNPDSPLDERVGMLDPVAYKQACQKLLRDRTGVAVLEVAEQQSPWGALALSAGALYRAGAAVVAAAGNGYASDSAELSWVGSPGVHPWVIAVGGRVTSDPTRIEPNQSRGLVGLRNKPDLQAPTATSSAGLGGEEALLNLAGTSGATPYAGAAALILRNWMRASNPQGSPRARPDPGQVYAAMIACGDGTRSEGPAGNDKRFPVASGAGLIRLPAGGRGWWGKVSVGSFATLEVPIAVDEPGLRRVRAAIWWPDPEPFFCPWSPFWAWQHADFDLQLLGPDGQVRASSEGSVGVFERLAYGQKPALSGTWRLRIVGRNVGLIPRAVYVAALAGP